MSSHLIELLTHAADIIDCHAINLRMSMTVPPDHVDWQGEEAALADYHDMKTTVGRLTRAAQNLRRQQNGIARATEYAHQEYPARDGMICCHVVSADLLPAVSAVGEYLERTQPAASGDQRLEMIFSAGVRHLMLVNGLNAAVSGRREADDESAAGIPSA